ncbi:hypothetical protein [Sphingopyxis sp. Root154]|uniref:hypothetical protein n=1 Tax=Sphingopyxis sp. Root154 TaxID=1736476 RepID=UPI001F1C2FF7|nr:hypothetical protein [Sphingopyxis sp. Root154]
MLFVISIAYAIIIGKIPLDAKTNVITTFSILLGFGFSVIFFLGTENKSENSHSIYLEDAEIENRKATVRKELFYNVSYFNILALFSIFTIIMTMIPLVRIAKFEVLTGFWGTYEELTVRTGIAISTFLCLESFYSFYWVLRKVTYLFDKKFGNS